MNVYDFSYTGLIQEFKAPQDGKYKLECWGAQGGAGQYGKQEKMGKGGYATGIIELKKGTTLFVVVGQNGTDGTYYHVAPNTFNGGSTDGDRSGGGATDFRLKCTDLTKWNEEIGLYSRILVAGGGGGHYVNCKGPAGAGGGLHGADGYRQNSYEALGGQGGKQTPYTGSSLDRACVGTFGKGGEAIDGRYNGVAYNGYAGGGGWYGGNGGRPCDVNGNLEYASGGGGSGYALTSTSYKPAGYTPTSTFWLSDTLLIAGNEPMPSPETSSFSTIGRLGHGFARVTLLEAANTPPVISGRDEYLGDKNSEFSISYTIDDKNSEDELKITESLNGSVINTIINPQRNKIYTINVNGSLFSNLLNNVTNTIEVKVSDGKATVYRRWTFIKTNTPPVITVTSGQNTNLGDLAEKPSTITYKITDGESDQCTVTEKINNETIRTFIANLGQVNSFTITDSKWLEMPKGSNTLKIEVVDSKGNKTVKSYVLNKVGNTVEVMFKNPIQTSIAATKILITPKWNITGGTGEVWVCNNGFDTSPTWENATSTIKLNRPFIFTNKSKTNTRWGINVKIKLIKNGGYNGEISLTGFGGAYE